MAGTIALDRRTERQPKSWNTSISAPNCTRPEEREFVPFLHELIGCAFAVIQPLFLADIEVQRKADDDAGDGGRSRCRAGAAPISSRRAIRRHGIVGEEFGERARESATAGSSTRSTAPRPSSATASCSAPDRARTRRRQDGYRPVLGCIAHAAVGLALIGHRRQTRLYRSDGSQRAVHVRAGRALAQATVLSTTPAGSAGARCRSGTRRASSKCAALARTWGDCFGYFALATGGADVMLDPVLSYWDVAAVVPVAEGAGACLSSWHGGDPLADLSLVATGSPELLREVLARIGTGARASPSATGHTAA
jgi:histidinol-phosphatase